MLMTKTTREPVVVFVLSVVVFVDAVVLFLLPLVVVDYNYVHVHFDMVVMVVEYHMKIHFDELGEFHYQILYDIKEVKYVDFANTTVLPKQREFLEGV